MIDRICISINNDCNLQCKYCHFREKGDVKTASMDIFKILDNVMNYAKGPFKIGYVGNGEPFLNLSELKDYIRHTEKCPWISSYTITNGTIPVDRESIRFFEEHKVNVGFSIDGYKELHDTNRCGTFDVVMENIEFYKSVSGHYPTFNATVGKESIQNTKEVIDFFKPFRTRVTFSRMIGRYGITLQEYQSFLQEAEKSIEVRRGGKDCTMYGGECGAGINNFFFANGKTYLCGNCIDLPPVADSNILFQELEEYSIKFDRKGCYKESL